MAAVEAVHYTANEWLAATQSVLADAQQQVLAQLAQPQITAAKDLDLDR